MSSKVFTIMPRDTKTSLSQLRHKEIIPGIIYGQSLIQAIPIQLKLSTLQNILNDPTTMIFKLELNGQLYDCVLREFQTDHLHTEILHVDFQLVKPGEVIKMHIPIHFEGIEVLRNKKYILEKAVTQIPVKVPVEILPEAFVMDVTNFEQGSKIYVSTLNLPPEVEVLLHPDTIVATIQ